MKKVMVLMIMGFLLVPVSAQVYTGGNMSINYNNGIYADVSPIVGYRIEKFKVGVSPFFSYSEAKSLKGVYSFGGRVFSEYDIIKGIFAHGEFGIINNPDNQTAESDDRVWSFSLPVGVGYEQIISKKVRVHAMVLYDFLLDKNSTQDNPSFRAGATYDF